MHNAQLNQLLRLSFCAVAALSGVCTAHAQSITMTGSMGNKALLVVDGSPPKAVSAGQIHRGVKVLAVASDQTVVEAGGKRLVVQMGAAPVSVGARAGASGGSTIVLTAVSGGHFVTSGTINGRAVEFLVDTGATLVSMDVAQAKLLGIDYEKGQQAQSSTANGVVKAFVVRLQKIRIQDVELYDVEASVSMGNMPGVLLGNSFLTRFQMKRDNDQLTLTKRF
jgi:aspartyl protease family protein